MSASPKSTTVLSPLVSLSESEAFLASGFFSSFFSVSLFSSFFSCGSPSGKAVLNLPVRRTARA
jgi:hypothetical protein